MSSNKPVRTRMAPSPTGELHIGGLRTLLYDYALAKQSQGQFIMRIEDTDQKRYVAGAEKRLLEVTQKYGLNWDEGPDIGGPYAPYVQSKRLDIYQQYIQELLDKKLAYHCFCTEDRLKEVHEIQKASKKIQKYDRHCLQLSALEIETKIKNGESFVIRMKIPDNQTIVCHDLVRGEIKFNSNDIDDQVLVKSNGIPTYHLAAVIDDHLMKISHVFRGEEWISSTPKHVLLYQFFGWEVPSFVHLTVFLDPNGHGKMSKRHGSTHAQAFLDDGYLPEAVLNFVMLLGWNPGTEKELFTLDEFVKEFSLDHLHKKAPIFDRKKLDYFNGLYIRQLSNDKFGEYFKKFLPQISDDQVKILTPVLKERIVKFSDLKDQLKFLFEDVVYDKELFVSPLSKDILIATKKYFESLTEINVEKIKQDLLKIITDNGWKVGDFFMVFRVAICGVIHTPPVVECLPALGLKNTLRKIDIALNLLQ